MQFNKIEFGNKLKEARIKKELSLRYIAKMLGKAPSTISRYENGVIIPSAKEISKLCEILDIYKGELYEENEEKILNLDNSKNPFKVNKLYLYYLGYTSKTKIGKFKLVIDLKEKSNYIEVMISDFKTNKIILKGHLLADDFIATIRTENYKTNYPRLETNQIILNISGGTEDFIRGIMLCTNGEYIPNVKKCIVTKKNLAFDDDLIKMLELDETEKKQLLKTGIWKANISKEEKFEYND